MSLHLSTVPLRSNSTASRAPERRTAAGQIASPVGRYCLLAGLGFVLVLLETMRATHEVGDFWEHAATVRELMLHVTSPGNALLAVHTPSAFFSPYTLLVALAANLSGAGAVHALAGAGLVNYCLLVAGVWCFTRVFSQRPQAPFYALLFLWLLWGVHPWEYSGFFDLRELGYGISYPSTFATAIGMLTAGLWQHSLSREGRARWTTSALTALGVAIVALTHPVAGVATVAAILAISATMADRRRSLLVLGAILVVGGLLCLAWPYYPALRLLQNQSVYDPSNELMYNGWIEQIFPVLTALALFFYSTGSLRRLRLGIYCAPLLLLFLYGDISSHYSDGRDIAYLVLGGQIGLADLAATIEQRTIAGQSRLRVVLLAAVFALFAILELGNMVDGLRGSLPGTGSPEPAAYADYRAAVQGLPPNSIIAAPLDAGMESAIPVYGGKLIGTLRPLAFVTDQTQRQQAVNTFYSPNTTNQARRQLIAHYHVNYVLVPLTPNSRNVDRQIEQLGRIVHRADAFDTLAV